MNQFDNRQKKDASIDPNQKQSQLDQATMPEQNRDEVRRRFKSVDQRKGAELLNQGVHDRSNDAGRDAILDPSRIARPQMMEMIKGVFPELNSHPSYQAKEFLKAFENPALIRSYLINPQETAAALMQRFPDLKDVILKNMPFQKIGPDLQVNPASGLYQAVLQELNGGVQARDSFVRKEMDHLLSSTISARVGGSMGMETKAYELIHNRIESAGQFNKKGAIIVADISRLMQSPQARQDFKEAQALADQGPLAPQASIPAVTPSGGVPVIGGGTVNTSQLTPVSAPTPAPLTTPGPATPPTPGPGIPVVGGGTVNAAGLTPVSPPVQTSGGAATPLPPSMTIPGTASAPAPAAPTGAAPAPTPPSPAPAGARPAAPAPAAPAAAAATTPAATPAPATPATTPATPAPASATPATPAPSTPAPSTPAQPVNNLITDRERMLQEQVAQLEAQVKKEASTPVTPTPPAAPAPSTELEQLKKENKDLNDRLAKVEKTLDELMNKNSALEKENAELKDKVADLQKQNDELKKSQPAPADKQSTEQKQALSDEQIKARAKELYDAIGYVYDDEAKVLSSLAGLSSADQGRLSVAFKKEYGEDMDAYIADSLDETDLAIVIKLRQGSRPGTEDATKVYNIFNGWTNKDDLTQALKGKSVEEIAAMAKEYEYITGESFQDAVKSEFWFESDRKPFLDLVDHAQEAVKLVESGSPVFKRAHQAISSLPPEASIYEARAWATRNRALFEGLGATPGNQAEFVSYLQKVHGFKKDQTTVDPGEFFNQKIADAAVREIARAVTYKTMRTISMGPGDRGAPITYAEPDRDKIGNIFDSLSDIPQVQGLIENHPDVKKFALEAKPASGAAPAASTTPATGPILQPNVTINALVDLLNKDGGAVGIQDFLLDNRANLATLSDQEVTQAFRSVKPAELGKFARSLRDDDGILTSSILTSSLLTEEDAQQLQRISDLANQVAPT